MDIKRLTSGLLGFPLVLAILLIGNKIFAKMQPQFADVL